MLTTTNAWARGRALRRLVSTTVVGGALILVSPLLASSTGAVAGHGSLVPVAASGFGVASHEIGPCSTSPSTSTTYPQNVPHARTSHSHPSCAPNTPANLKVTRHGTTITGTWFAVPGAWYLCTLTFASAPSSVTIRTNLTTCSFRNTNSTAPYGIDLIAVNEFGQSPKVFSKAPAPTVHMITCQNRRGTVRHVTATSPLCPTGYHRIG